MHHADAGYDVNDPGLTAQQRDLVEFSSTGSTLHVPITNLSSMSAIQL